MVKWIYPFSSKKIKFLFFIQRGRDDPACLVMRERDLPKTKNSPHAFPHAGCFVQSYR